LGYGDEVMGSGMARGAAARGRRVAFGDGKRIIWGPHCAEVYKNNPNVAPPGADRDQDLEWKRYYSGNRGYVRGGGGKFIFNPDFRAPRGEFFFDEAEISAAGMHDGGFVVVDAYLPSKPAAANKKWGHYERVAEALAVKGEEIRQFRRPGQIVGHLPGVKAIDTPTFRAAAAILARAALYIGPEGGLHHAAAAVNTPAVVLFGGFIDPKTTGYEGHVNIFTGGTACGSLRPCQHCADAMAAIAPATVIEAAEGLL
jgi:hypothetical protein